MQGGRDLVPHALRELFAVRVERVAGFGRDNQARRHGQSCLRHLAQAGAFAAKQGFVIAAAFFKKIDPLVRLFFGTVFSKFFLFNHWSVTSRGILAGLIIHRRMSLAQPW